MWEQTGVFSSFAARKPCWKPPPGRRYVAAVFDTQPLATVLL